MFPVLITLGKIPISSLGIFLVLALFCALFLVWRLSRAWDLDAEKILDITFITSFGAFFTSRLYFVLQYWDFFSQDIGLAFAIFQYPGFSFWGAFLGGWLTLYFIARRSRLDYAQILDIAAIGFLGSLFFGDLGCFLGSCDVGFQTNWFFGVSQVGHVGKRFPIQLIEALLVGTLLLKIWYRATHFHIAGTVASRVLIWVGIVKFLTEFFRSVHMGGYFFSLVLIALGISLNYRFTKRQFKRDFEIFKEVCQRVVLDGKFRKLLLQTLAKGWYTGAVSSLNDSKVAVEWRFRSMRRILKKLNVKSTTKNT